MAKRSLLLVDGDAKSLRVLEVSLKKAGFNVTTASTGADALEKVENSQPDLVISDTVMPEMDGYTFCREFKKRPEWAEIPFVFLTGQTAIEHKIKGLELGVDDYLTKPIYIKEILTRVRILLQKRDRANFEQKKDNNTRFAGRLNDMGVVDLIQTIEVSRKTGVIHFRADEQRQATLFFKEGRVIDAEAGHLQGADAVYRLLTWSDGEFEALFRPVRRKAIIEMSTQALLMEGMRRLDEWGRLQEQLPPLTQRFEVVYDELWDRLADLPDDLNQILRLFDSRRTLAEVIDGANIGDLEAVEIISKLYFEGIIVEAGTAVATGGSGTFAIDDLLARRNVKASNGASADGGADQDSELLLAETPASPSAEARSDAEVADAPDEAAPESQPSTDPLTPLPKPALDEILDRAIDDAGPAPISRGDEVAASAQRSTNPGLAVAQLKLEKRAREEVLASNLRKNGSDARRRQKKSFTQPYAGTTQPPEPASEESSEDAYADEAAAASGETPEAGNGHVNGSEANGENLPVPLLEVVPPGNDSPGDDGEENFVVIESISATAPASSDAAEPEVEATAARAESPGEDDPHELVTESMDDEGAGTGSLSLEVEADYADGDDDAAPERPYVEEVRVAGVISSAGAVNASVSGAVAGGDTRLGGPGRGRASSASDLNLDIDEAEPIRAAPSISGHDDDDDDDKGPSLGWIAGGGLAAVAALAFAFFGGTDPSAEGNGEAPLSAENLLSTGTPAFGDIPSDAAPEAMAEKPAPDAAAEEVAPDPSPKPEKRAPDRLADQPEPAPKPKKPDPEPTKPAADPDPEGDAEERSRELLTEAQKNKRQGNRIEALLLIDESLELRKSSTALLMKAEILMGMGDSGAALQVATELTDVASRRAQGWRIRGLAEYEEKKYEAARKSFTRYLELSPNAPDAADVRLLLDSL